MGGTARSPPGSTDAVTMRVVTAIAEREGVEPTELPQPLYTTIDPDALEALLAGADSDFVRLEFTYCGHHVTVERDDEVRVDVE